MTTEEMKRAAASAAAELVEDGMKVGLGSGSTAREFVRALGKRVTSGLTITAVASSDVTADLARQVGIPLTDLECTLDLAVDGADAIAPTSLAAIKGLGGALTRERIVAETAARFILIVDESKVYPSLNEALTALPIPVSTIAFGWTSTRERLTQFGEPVLRMTSSGAPYRTDDGNYILDVYDAHTHDLVHLGHQIKGTTGVVDHGLFLNLATLALIGTQQRVVTQTRS